MLAVPSCVVHDIDLLIMVPFAGCLLTAAFGSDWFGLVWFSFRYVFNLANATKQDSFIWYRGCAISAHFTIN